MVNRIKNFYKNKIVKILFQSLNTKNIHEVPKLIKITINTSLGLSALNSSTLNNTINEFRLITGQQPIVTNAKKSIAGFKIRENMSLGVTVTLRGEKMYAFLERFITVALPRSRDFQGLNPKSFDRFGNYTIGLNEQLLFPEINYDSVDKPRGFNITFVTNTRNKKAGLLLLKKLGLPIREKI